MPNAEQIRKTQERREARANAKKTNVQASIDQEHELAALSDRLRAKKGQVDPDARFNEAGLRVDQVGMAAAAEVDDTDPEDHPKTSVKAKSRAAQKVAAQIAAEQQADIDVRATVAQPDEHDLSQYAANGTEPPLHVLNAIARKADNDMRDTAAEAAQAAGRAAYDVLTERRNQRNPETRHKTVEEAMRAAAAAKSQVGAADPVKE